MTHGDRPIACVGGLAYDEAGRLLLVQRANEPGRGLWSVPGGRVEPGEDDAAALVREMREETGLRVTPDELVGRVQRGPFAIATTAARSSTARCAPATTRWTPGSSTGRPWRHSRSSTGCSTPSPSGTPSPGA